MTDTVFEWDQAALWKGSWWRGSTEESIVENIDPIRRVEEAIVIRFARRNTRPQTPTEEECLKNRDAVGNVHL